MPVIVLDDLAARVRAAPLREAWRASSPANVLVACEPTDWHDALLVELLIDALRRDLPEARFALAVPGRFSGLHELLSVSLASGERPELQVLLGAAARGHRAGVLSIPWRFEEQDFHYDRSSFVASLRAAGTSVTTRAPRLVLDATLKRRGLRWVTERVGRFSGPLVVVEATAPCGPQLGEALRKRIGAVVMGQRSLPEELPLRAAVLEHAALVVATEGALAHLAAALAAPSLVFVAHGAIRREPSGERTMCIVEEAAGDFEALELAKIVTWATTVAARAWPYDRLRRLLPSGSP